MERIRQDVKKQAGIKKILNLHAMNRSLKNQDGSIMMITLMILATITIIGLISSDTAVTEKFIIRNHGIYKQNLNIVESAMMEGLQLFMQRPSDDQDIIDVSTSPLVNDINGTFATTTWYASNPSGQLLNTTNTSTIKLLPITLLPENITDRGETTNTNLRTAFAGWENVKYKKGGSESLGIGSGQPIWRQGRLMSEYVSTNNRFGTLRMEIGVKRRLVPN